MLKSQKNFSFFSLPTLQLAKNSPKIAQMSRARALMINNKRNLAAGEGGGGVSRPVLIALGAGLTGLGIAAAAGAFNSSK